MKIYIPEGWMIGGLLLTWFVIGFCLLDKRDLGPADTYADTQMSFFGAAILTVLLWFAVGFLLYLCGIKITVT